MREQGAGRLLQLRAFRYERKGEVRRGRVQSGKDERIGVMQQMGTAVYPQISKFYGRARSSCPAIDPQGRVAR